MASQHKDFVSPHNKLRSGGRNKLRRIGYEVNQSSLPGLASYTV